MKSLLPSLLVTLLFIVSAPAQIPRTISYQGVLCDASGNPKPDAIYTVTFRLYNAESGGTLLWSEPKDIATSRGLFSTQLGDQVPFGPDVTFATQYWLSIQVGAEEELSRRIPLSSVGTSYRSLWSESAAYAEYAVRAIRSDTAAYASVAGSGGSSPWLAAGNDIYYDSGRVGIGTSAPASNLHVTGERGVLFEGTFGSGAISREGEGIRLMWHPRKAAFRAGHADAAAWNDSNIGPYSAALGFATTASGNSSTALGLRSVASGTGATAMGVVAVASGNNSTAMGHFTEASGLNSTAIGHHVSTAGYDGSFIIGDNSSDVDAQASKSNEFKAVFAGGYTLWTDRSGQHGVYMNGQTSGWSNISDRAKKENLRAIDGEELLSKVRSLPVTEWNYKSTDPSIRYIGPMAQDFYAAFHLGGTDSLGINSICIDGVNMAAIQALERRTAELGRKTAELETLKAEMARLEERLARLEAALRSQEDFTEQRTEATAGWGSRR